MPGDGGKAALFFSERLRRHRQPSKCHNKDMPLAKVLNCWIKDKDTDKARTGSSMVAQANLFWFHSRRTPGLCVWQVSFQLGWKPSPVGTTPLIHPTPNSLSQCCKPILEWSDGQSTSLGSLALTRIHAKDVFPRDLQEGCGICFAICLIFKEYLMDTSGTTRKWTCGEFLSYAQPAMPQRTHGGSFGNFQHPLYKFCSPCLQQTHLFTHSKAAFCGAAPMRPTEGIKLREASEL